MKARSRPAEDYLENVAILFGLSILNIVFLHYLNLNIQERNNNLLMVLFLLKFFSRPSGWPSPFRCTASTWEGFSNQSPPGSDLAMKCFNQSINQSLTWDFQINLLQVQILLWNVLTIPISEYCTLPHLLSFWLSSGLTSRGKYFFSKKTLLSTCVQSFFQRGNSCRTHSCCQLPSNKQVASTIPHLHKDPWHFIILKSTSQGWHIIDHNMQKCRRTAK